jgi:hypothetical protein
MLAKELLGNVPSRLDLMHPDSVVVARAGYRVTDFGSLFGAPEEGFLVTSPRGNIMTIREIVVESLGPLVLANGEVTLFDPSNASSDRTAIAVAEVLPAGAHEVWLARSNTLVLGALVVFAGDTPVASYRPARLGAADAPVPVPPRFLMAPTRLAIGIADRAAYVRARNDFPEFAPLQNLDIPHPRVVRTPGIVAFTNDAPASTWLGVDSARRPRVLALDFSQLRRWGGAVSQPGLSLAKLPLAVGYVLAGCEPHEAAELALSFRDHVAAYDRGGNFEPDERQAVILA